jgi:hypothetical protein
LTLCFYSSAQEPIVISVTEAERRRLQDAFRRLGGGPNGAVQKAAFVSEVLGPGFPPGLAERIYCLVCVGDGCGGGGHGGGSGSGGGGGGGGNGPRGGGGGVHFKELLALLVLVTKGTEEEKHKCKPEVLLEKSEI